MKTWSSLFSTAVLASALFLSGCGKEKVAPESTPEGATVSSNTSTCPTQVATPSIVCSPTSPNTQTTINVTVTAGITGTPGGFVIEYMRESDYIANNSTFFTSPNSKLFSVNLTGSEYLLAPIVCGSVDVCITDLACGTNYVFRVRANAGTFISNECGCIPLSASGFSTPVTCCTSPCPTPPAPTGCTYTQGYYKNHGPNNNGNQTNQYPASALPLLLGTTNTYTAVQLQNILRTPVQGNGLISLAHQLIAAKLNIAKGASVPLYIQDAINAADALIGTRSIFTGRLSTSETSGLVAILTSYNEGTSRGGPRHCE